jgi:alkanesulfonate monooxygenase SsuD/methylene tetrahydromethanopterin reductase-like flavin-dependent oxidoreductase (luciferase family)
VAREGKSGDSWDKRPTDVKPQYPTLPKHETPRFYGLTFVGDPDYVAREIRAHMQELGAGVFMGLFQFGSLPHALATKNIELFAKTVLAEKRPEGLSATSLKGSPA